MSTDTTIANMDRNRDAKVQKFEAAYGDYMEVAAEAMKEKFKYEWSSDDSMAFGTYASTWEDYRPLLEADMTSRNTIGEALNSNLGLIAMAYAALPIQNLASVQPLTDEAGTVFYRHGVANQTRGGVTAGQDLIGPLGAINPNIGDYVSETFTVSGVADGTATGYDLTSAAELRPGSLKVSVGGGKVKGMDDGEGNILGVGIVASKSTVNYQTGAIHIELESATVNGVAANDAIDVTVSQNFVASDQIPSMKWVLDPKVVRADYYILQSQYSNLSELVLRKRFGTDLSDQVSADLVAQITSSVMFKAIGVLRQSAIKNEIAAGATLTWSKAAPAGISDADYRKTFDDKLIEAVGMMYKIAGKGDVTALVVGTTGKKILKTAGMQMIRSAVSGPHLCGMYDSVPVYYAPNTVLGDNEILVIYRGSNWFESPIVYAPFLPVTTVSGSAVQNVMTSAQAAFHSAAIEEVNQGFCIRISLV